MTLQQRVETLVSGAALAYVPGCFYVVRVGEGLYLGGVHGTVPWVVERECASSFGDAVSAAVTAAQWSDTATIERVVSR